MPLIKLQPIDSRIPNWGDDELMNRSCPICESKNFTSLFIRPDGLRVCICTSCSTKYINPSPNPKQIDNFYINYCANHANTFRPNLEKFLFETKLLSPASDIRITSYLKLLQQGVNLGHALDIGCGRGQFLYLLKKIGFKVDGVELDISSKKYTKKLGLNSIFFGNLEDYKSAQKYDLITMLDLIEHPLEPIKLLQTALKLLAPGGHLLIWTPNGNPGEMVRNNFTFRVDLEHMQYLTKDSCHHIANILNLKIAHIETLGDHMGFEELNLSELSILQGITSHMQKLKQAIKNLPGWYKYIAPIYHAVNSKNTINNISDKDYHLLCIFKK